MKRWLTSCFLVTLLLSASSQILAQSKTVSGTISDLATKLPLEGVNINLKGTPTTVISNAQGEFSIAVPSSQSVLVFSYIGYGTIERTVGDNNTIVIALSTTQKSLDEVVVIGYGAVKRRDLTGAVTSIKNDIITQTPTHNPLEAIQGRAAGVDITRSSGAAGSGVNINIRGFKSIAARDQLNARNAPLIIIDGFQGGDISTLNANDIESMEILKDASATAIYGAQGGNGVIIVTTKRGAAGKIKVNYSGFYGISTFMYPELRLGQDYLQLRREAWRNSIVGGVPEWQSPADDPKLFTNLPGEYAAFQANKWVDWLDLLQQNGQQQSHTISLTSGTDKTKFYLSGGYFKETGMLRNNDFTRYNVRINADQQISRIAKAGLTSQITYSNQNLRRDPLGNLYTISPLGDPFDSTGTINRLPLQNDNRVSPLADEANPYVSRDNIIRTNVLAGGFVELAPIRGLTIRSALNVTLNNSRRGTYNDRTSLAQASSQLSVASQTTGMTRFLNWDNTITYSKSFKDHSLTATGITSYLRSDDDQLTASGSGQILASQIYYGLSQTSTAVTRTISSPFARWANIGYAGRLTYSYRGKYVLYVSGRYDGASRLSPGNKWDFFPAAGVAWNISDEKFMEKVEVVDNLKLRATYGVSGNYNIDVYGTQSGLTYTPRMSFGEVAAPAYLFNATIGNPDVSWEKSATLNLGADFALLKNRITGSIDWFKTETSDILYKRALPLSSGVTDVFENIASTLNKGLEIAISSINVRSKNFRWTSGITFTKVTQEITNIVNGKDVIVDERNSLLQGRAITAFYTYIKEGIWQQDEAAAAAALRFGSASGNTFKPGDIKLRDISGPNGKPDGIVDATYDRAYVGSTVPDWIGGLQNTFNYKNFDLGVFLMFRYGQTIHAEFLGRYNPQGTGNSPAMINYWTPENPTNDFPRPSRNQLINYAGYQTLTFIDGSYFKVKNITLGYTLPKNISSKIASDNIRFYVTGSNVFTKAKSHLIKDYDPEREGAESSPIGRTFVIGVNLGF
jgi:TonB-linked SusC/RagA family outer membrane protein